ncbi:condensin complex subunit 3 isoform X1 [Drosophila elegans]|uniref:condensin complex subunit 3 isoform X1 n=1 Tax=Drosophila elegans TaxID=30023 RepID=UPI001BC84482|nr:condensin complex subunit 3 isoform X1 [Drosophila elegans]
MTRPKGKANEKATAKKTTGGWKLPSATKEASKDGEKENEDQGVADTSSAPTSASASTEAMYSIMRHAELKESLHKRFVKEMQQLYTKMGHNSFKQTFINVLKAVLEAEEGNENANTALNFCATFVSTPDETGSEPMLGDTFRWLLTTYSASPHIRYRICYFINLILKELGPNAALDDSQCDDILEGMLDRVKDVSAMVRKQAVLAMQRLQNPDSPSDPVVCAYQYHLSADPSSNVRQCIISCMGRNYITIPHILQRLWDVDEKVRRHTYVNLCNYPVRSYKVAQRLTLLEQGLNDTSATVRKTVVNYMLKTWIESYQQNYVALTAALKLDSNEEELLRFRRVAKQMLRVIFEQTDHQKLVDQLPLSDDCELHRCIPHELLTVELLIYWQCLSEFLETEQPEMESVLPELSVFCNYVDKFCQFQKPDMDKFAQVEFQNMLLSLVEILQSYDLGDEIGRGNMRQLIAALLKDCLLDHKIVCVLVRCMEQLITDLNDRMQFFIEIIYELCELNTKQNELIHDRSLINKLLDDLDTPLKMKISSLKVRILEMEEQEDNFVRQKEYIRAQSVNDEKTAVTEEYTELIRPVLERNGVLEKAARPKLSKQERVLKGLYICYYMTASPHVHKLTPSLCQLYKDFICRYLACAEVDIFEWAIKCGTTYSMFYEAYSKEVFEVVLDQYCNNNIVRLCETAANCILELLDHYGVDYFNDLNQAGGNVSKTKRRQLYTMQEIYDDDDGSMSQNNEQNSDIIVVMGHYMERVQNKNVGVAIARGLCRLVLRGHLDDRPEVLEQLLKRYFNPNTEAIISQVLGMFFEELRRLNKQCLLQPCFLPTVWTIMNCSIDSPLNGVQPENFTKFFFEMTVQENSTPQTNIHNKLAISFLQYIQNYFTERKEMCRLLAKELTRLSINVFNGPEIKAEMLDLADKLIANELEPRMIKNIGNFKLMVNGSFNPPPRRNPEDGESDDECETGTVTTADLEVPAPAPTQIEAPAPSPEESSSLQTPTSAPETHESETSAGEAAATPKAVKAAEAAVPPIPEPIVTTYGKDNIVGIRYLRRSMAISLSDAESLLETQAVNAEENTETEAAAAETSKRNSSRPQMRRRLQMAMARSSKTPEKKPASSDLSSDEEISESPARVERANDSEVIQASPTAASPSPVKAAPNASHLRLRSLRSRKVTATAGTSMTQTPSNPPSKRKVLHLETPLRNGRKRVLRRTPSDPNSLRTTSDSTALSPPRGSPLRKQPCLDNRSSRRQQMAKNTNSPTDSTSSVKENQVPPVVVVQSVSVSVLKSQTESDSESDAAPEHRTAKSKKPIINKALHVIRSRPSSSTPKVTTRNDSRSQRINSMCMTRKRMSLEMNLSGGQLQVSTPKRVTRSVAMSMSVDSKRSRRK